MKHSFLILLTIFFLVSCNSTKKVGSIDYGSPNKKQELLNDLTFKVDAYSNDKTYGYTEKNPIMVGGNSEGPKNERRFLNALSGPNGENLEYYRIGSCCMFTTKNGSFGGSGMLDMYSINYPGLDKDITLYINMYDSDTLKVPVGFKLKD
ncbi:MAG: hypothetical protein K8R31_12965 [Bacteroidales bacterium]|nr:hypothetical protein [Bacteroidales bacterium]